jgi:hypothetical protein
MPKQGLYCPLKMPPPFEASPKESANKLVGELIVVRATSPALPLRLVRAQSRWVIARSTFTGAR